MICVECMLFFFCGSEFYDVKCVYDVFVDLSVNLVCGVGSEVVFLCWVEFCGGF